MSQWLGNVELNKKADVSIILSNNCVESEFRVSSGGHPVSSHSKDNAYTFLRDIEINV